MDAREQTSPGHPPQKTRSINALAPDAVWVSSRWRAVAPRVIGSPELAGLDAGAFGGVIDPARPGVTLLRPDRFVLAHLDSATATDTLDALAATLSGEA